MPSMARRQALKEKPDPDSETVVTAPSGTRVKIVGQQNDFLNIFLVDELDQPSGWVPKSSVSDEDPTAEPIDPEEFSRECWWSAIYAQVNPHYLMAVGKMRSNITNNADATGMGPFRLRQTEWDANWNGAELGYQYGADDIRNWRSQCSMFGLMVRRTMEEMGNGQKSALDLYLAQIIGAKAAAALKKDPSKEIDTILGSVAVSDLPKGSTSAADIIERYATFLKTGATAARGEQVSTAIASALQKALDATKGLILAGGASILDTPESSLSAAPPVNAAKIDVKAVDYAKFEGGGNIDSWITEACQKAGLPHTDGWVQGYRTICRRESSNRPNAINTTDSNARGPIVADGFPQGCSRGLAQCIPPTFAAYHVPDTSARIYDPVANIAASMQYVRQRYRVSEDGSDLAMKVQQADPNRPPKGY